MCRVAAGARQSPTTADHCKSHAVCSGLITFPFKISDIRKEFGARATARAVQKTVAPHGKREAFVFRIPCDTAQISITYFNYNRLKTRLTERAPQERRG